MLRHGYTGVVGGLLMLLWAVASATNLQQHGSDGVQNLEPRQGILGPNVNGGLLGPNVNAGLLGPNGGLLGHDVNAGLLGPNVNAGLLAPNVNGGFFGSNRNGGILGRNTNGGIFGPNINAGILGPNVNGLSPLLHPSIQQALLGLLYNVSPLQQRHTTFPAQLTLGNHRIPLQMLLPVSGQSFSDLPLQSLQAQPLPLFQLNNLERPGLSFLNGLTSDLGDPQIQNQVLGGPSLTGSQPGVSRLGGLGDLAQLNRGVPNQLYRGLGIHPLFTKRAGKQESLTDLLELASLLTEEDVSSYDSSQNLPSSNYDLSPKHPSSSHDRSPIPPSKHNYRHPGATVPHSNHRLQDILLARRTQPYNNPYPSIPSLPRYPPVHGPSTSHPSLFTDAIDRSVSEAEGLRSDRRIISNQQDSGTNPLARGTQDLPQFILSSPVKPHQHLNQQQQQQQQQQEYFSFPSAR